jgi:hypothetical protein
MKRFILAFIAAYIFMFCWGWFLNGVLLKDVYAETPNLWRSQSEMMNLFHWIIIGQALLIFAFVAIYASGFAGGGVMAGIRLGGPAGDRSHWHASRHLRDPAVSRKVDYLRERQWPHLDDNRRGNRGSNLQTRSCENCVV